MHIHFIIHESYEGPAAFNKWVVEKGFYQTTTRLYLGEQLPEKLDFDLLVVLGGPQSPLTTVEECPYFNVDREVSFIGKCISESKAIVGVCLGAQLIGEALGAKFERSPHKEIGYFPITVTTEGKENKIFERFQPLEVVGHWHNDMPGMLSTSKVLAYSEGCPRQIVEYSDTVYGFQCHLEFTKDSVQDLIASAFDENLLNDNKWIQEASEIMAFNTNHMNNLLYQFLDYLVVRYKNVSVLSGEQVITTR
ncbi:MAG: GMP synthase (glutamine-hydrolyzing) [Oleiphilaceae bacterium]|jgi:GMP synthase (glutamine-hydrolysing)